MNGLVRSISTLKTPAPNDNLLDEAGQRARRLMALPLNLESYVFHEEKFPELSAADTAQLENLIGPHRVEITFYDGDYNVVTQAEKPGRYGAVIEIAPENGRVTRRFRTLFRQPQAFAWWRTFVPVNIEMPDEIGISAQALQAHGEEISNYLKMLWLKSARDDWQSAALLAGLYENVAEDVWARDRQWWVGLKRKIYQMDAAVPFESPQVLADQKAPVLRDGNAQDAGIAIEASEKLDALCNKWAQNSDQAFAVCLARHGVIWFERAYGADMTIETPTWMASISKLLAGSLLMMLVDQNRVDLDEPISAYLPVWRDVETSPPLTLRHLMTHTAGLWEHLGDEMHDWEEIVAQFAPHLEIGQRYEYNGASLALAGKIIEAVTGEALPHCFARHLLKPLGMNHTTIGTMSWNTQGTARDLATFGQMLLNQGAYGDQKFFSAETFQMLLPQPLTKTLGPNASEEYGIGSSWFRDEGLGAGTFAHGAASAATLRIDPENDLIVMMARNDAGENFDKYHPQFLQIISESVAD